MSKKPRKMNKKPSKSKIKEETVKEDKYVSYESSGRESPLKKLYEKDMIYYHLFVKDLTKMRNFYEQILEFELAGESPEEFGFCDFFLPVHGARLGLSRIDKKLENTNAAPSLNIPVKDLEKSHKLLKEKGIEVTNIQDIPKMISMFDFRDPEGNRISFLGAPK